ncbi:MAG: small acid-soluble spore protein SspI [Bacilli bacterium]|nr:small acid-soluble spore protein SspI [Bacilli bacterium]
MSTDIRKYIKKNFKGADVDEIKESISSSISEKEEVTLPGLGVFFEILWDNSGEKEQEQILNTIRDHIK